jgi:6-phosphofructokinase 1
MRIGVLTSGGDCPGLNAVIRALVRKVERTHGGEVLGFRDAWRGVLDDDVEVLTVESCRGILPRGGTILGTSRIQPYQFDDGVQRVRESVERHRLDGFVVIGGNGSLGAALDLQRDGVPCIGVPKTIDNDLSATDTTFGFDTAVSIVSEAIDRLTTTASSHHRVMVIEVMGRYAGWIALAGGMAGGADTILIPEIPFRWDAVFRHVRHRAMRGRRFSIVCVAEGAKLPEGGEVIKGLDDRRTDAKQLGGVGAVVARRIEEGTGLETRVTVLGHLQRGGSPTAYDRILATRFGVAAAQAACRGESGVMVALRGTDIVTVPIADAIATLRTVPPDHPMVAAARAVGTRFGDEVPHDGPPVAR